MQVSNEKAPTYKGKKKKKNNENDYHPCHTAICCYLNWLKDPIFQSRYISGFETSWSYHSLKEIKHKPGEIWILQKHKNSAQWEGSEIFLKTTGRKKYLEEVRATYIIQNEQPWNQGD